MLNMVDQVYDEDVIISVIVRRDVNPISYSYLFLFYYT